MNEFSDEQIKRALQNAQRAGRKSDADALGAELARRGGISPSQLQLASGATIPGPQGFMEDSGLNAMGRGVVQNIGGGAGAALGGAAGMKGGAAVGTMLGGPGLGSAIGGGIGGVGGGLLGALFGGKVQEAAFPTSEDLNRQLAMDQQNHPGMSFIGENLPYLAALKPSLGGIKSAVTPLNAGMSALEREAIIGHRVGSVVGAGLGGAGEVAMPMINGQDIDPMRVLGGTLLGALFNEPNRLGRAIGMPSTATLAEVRAQQMAQAAQPPPTSTALVPYNPAPLIDTEVIKPGAIGPQERGAYPVNDNVDVRFVQPKMLTDDAAPMALPQSGEAGADSVMPAMRQEQADAIGQQLARLQQRRTDMVSRGVDKAAIKTLDAQIKARTNALRGLQNETTIISQPQDVTRPPVAESGVAIPPPDRTPVDAPPVQPVDPRMLARATGDDKIATGERPAFISADAITQAKLAGDAVVQSPQGADALRKQLAAQEVKPEVVRTIPEDLARARENMAKGGTEMERVRASTEPVAAFRQQDGALKLYDGHHRLVNAIDSGAEALPVKIDGEGIKNLPISAFDAPTTTSPPNEKVPVIPESSLQHQSDGHQPVNQGDVQVVDSAVNRVGDNTSSAAANDTQEITSLRKQIAKADEDIFNARADGDEYGATGLEIARRRLQSRLDEAVSPTMPKTLGDKIRAKKVKVKGDKLLMPLLGISPDDARRAWNGALEVAAKLADAGAHIKKAAVAAAQWVRQNFPKATFKDAEFHKAIEADITNELPSARKAGVREAAHAAADDMDINPDKFFTDADSTPVKNYMDDVDRTMKDAKNDMMSGRTAKTVWQHIKDFNRNMLRGNQAALDDLANGSGKTGRKSPALDKLNRAINGSRPGASGVAKRGIWDDIQNNTRARTNELSDAYNGVRSTIDTLKGHEQEAFLANLVKWMQLDNADTHLKNQPAVLKAVKTLRKISRDLYNDLKAAGIDIGDAGEKYFSRLLDADTVKRNYDEFVNGMAKIYDKQWGQNDPKYMSDAAKALEAAKNYADAAILGHEGIHLDGSDLNLGVKRSGDPDFFKARTFTGAAGEELDRTMAKFYKRNPFETLNYHINRVERRIGLAKAFGKIDADGVLDPTYKWREFTNAAKAEGNEQLIPEALERYQTMFGIGGNFNPKTNAFNQFTRELGYYAYLPFSGINSMVEPTVIAMRMNKPFSGLFQSYGKTFRSIARTIKDMPLDYKERAADALGLAENATMRAARSMGKFDDQGLMSGKHLANYMYLTGNSIISNATANAGVDIGMSMIRLELNEFARGGNKNGARIWLEELGIKKSYFDRVSKWLEGHASDEERFTKLFDKPSAEARIVREALQKFVREARSMPDAGTKSKQFSNPFGSLLLSLQSFLYDFTDKVLGRNSRQFMHGMKGEVHFDGDPSPTSLSGQERAKLMAPMALGMPALLAANFGVALVRESLYPDPEKIRRDRERTAGEINWNRFTRSLSRTNVLGPYDMIFNMFTNARYERDVAAMALGPYMGGVLELAKNVAALGGERNSDNTNTAERKAVRSAWNIGPKPLINMVLSSLPATKQLTGIAAGGIQMASQRSVAEGAVDTIAGRQQTGKNNQKKPIPVP